MKRISNHARLLMNLFHHEMLIARFLSSFSIPLNLNKFLFYHITIKVIKSNFSLFQTRHLHVTNIIHVSRVLKDSRYIRGKI